ncbi:hypothetical protein HNR35_000917 [Borreliella spielmanii]|uniref:Uncharacterized protein n=1 Tax=Borreliella spielmanii TaxID=88916 RepID=A0ABR6P7A9_9SPIR|nr:complement regulator-acquiring protein [Borreliella spielmanii]MBB6031914.1 hypothetical protein [Borreliella spielmanii]
MIKTKLNIIKLNILTTILTLICISCTPINNITPKENNQNFENESQNTNPSNKKSQKTKASKLEIIGKTLEDQKKQEDIQIAQIDSALPDFLGTFKADDYDGLSAYEEMEIKRILYSSLNYERQKINTLKEILEQLNTNVQHKQTAKHFIYSISLSIQSQLSRDLALIQNLIEDNLHTLKQKESEILITAESDLKLKENFAKTLNKTIEDYNRNDQSIKISVVTLANYFDEKYKDLDSFKPNN